MYTPFTIERRTLIDAAINAELDVESALRFDYSGRSMYGEKCFGVVHDSVGELLMFVAYVTQFDETAGEELCKSIVRQDSMGRSTITYWPYIQAGEEV